MFNRRHLGVGRSQSHGSDTVNNAPLGGGSGPSHAFEGATRLTVSRLRSRCAAESEGPLRDLAAEQMAPYLTIRPPNWFIWS